jgi:putative PIN family toxin of toxin-antitoxin system
VVDTSVLISAFAFGGIPKNAVRKAFTEAEIWVSPQLLKEYRETPLELEAENKITHAQLESLLSGIAAFVSEAKIVIPKKKLLLCRDESDNMVLECCLAARADCLITSDKDLLDLEISVSKQSIPRLMILSPKTFLRRT